MTDELKTRVVLKNVRLSYVALPPGRPRSQDDGPPKWQATILLPKDDTEQIAKVNQAIANAKKKDEAKIKAGAGSMRNPLLDGDAKEEGEFKYKGNENRGHYLLRANTSAAEDKSPPEVIKKGGGEVTLGDVYSGVYADISVNFYGYGRKDGKGVAPGLGNVKVLGTGERLAGGPRATDEFDEDDDDDLLK